MSLAAGPNHRRRNCRQSFTGRSRHRRGLKSEPHPKIEVYAEANGKPLMFPLDSATIGFAAGATVEIVLPVSRLDVIPAVAAMMQAAAVDIADALGTARTLEVMAQLSTIASSSVDRCFV
jgi:hypothetical protein